MGTIDTYRQNIKNLLRNYADRRNAIPDEVEAQTLFDEVHDHYQLIYIGWLNKRRVFGPVLHFDIKNDKIWLQWNGTEDDVGEALVQMGVPKEAIVIGFHPAYVRQYTDYAVG